MTKKMRTETMESMLEDRVNEMLDANENMSNKDKEFYEMGDFSKAIFEWLKKEALQGKNEKPSNAERQYKLRAKKTIIRSQLTLTLAAYLNDAFTEEEWSEIIQPASLYPFIYLASLKGGYEMASVLTAAIDRGLNDNLKATSNGLFKAQVGVTLLSDSDRAKEFDSKFGEIIAKRSKERLEQSEKEL